MSSRPLNIANVALRPASLRALFLVCMLLTLGSVITSGWHVALKAEHGALELTSFVCLAGAALIGAAFYRQGLVALWAVPAVFVLLALREVDFQNWWFDPGLVRTGIFSAPVPLWQKLVSGGVMIAILASLLTIVIRGSKPFFCALFAGKSWALYLSAGGAFVLFAILLDGFSANLAALNLSAPDVLVSFASYMEEVMEFGFAFSSLSALVLFAREAYAQDAADLNLLGEFTGQPYGYNPGFQTMRSEGYHK